ncbi:MAG: HEPN domain-containing protein [Armatimonadota bacterium]
MQHNSGNTGSPSQWLKIAKADLAIAGVPLPTDGMYEHLCFHAQQAAEKSIKAVLVHYNISFPFTHNLQVLLDNLPADIDIPDYVKDAIELNAYAVLARYPGEMEPASESDYIRALEIANNIYEWARHIINN